MNKPRWWRKERACRDQRVMGSWVRSTAKAGSIGKVKRGSQKKPDHASREKPRSGSSTQLKRTHLSVLGEIIKARGIPNKLAREKKGNNWKSGR